MISPLDQLYLDTTSKEDLLAEINDQRRQVIEARGLAAELDREFFKAKQEIEKLIDANRRLLSRINIADLKLTRIKKKYGEKRETISAKIAQFMMSGLTDKDIIALGYKRGSITPVRSRINAIEKAAQSI